MEYKFIKLTDFEKFEKTCLKYFEEGFRPCIGQPSIGTHSNDNSSTTKIYFILLEKENKIENRKVF